MSVRHAFIYDAIFFVAFLATVIALSGALAHALELQNKIGMNREQYFVVQQIYRGWDRLSLVLLVQLVSLVALIAVAWHDKAVSRLAIVALVSLAAAQVVFWIYTYPANTATQNWTHIPPQWEALRARWEYSHAAGAALQLAAMIALIVAALARGRSE